jgi:hypothetical protein
MNLSTVGQTMKSYLLGSLNDSRRGQLEERLLSDGELFEELLISEDELVDQYVAGRLTDREKRQFELHFLITDDRQRKFQFGRTFNKYLEVNDNSKSAAADARHPEPFPNQPAFWSIRRPIIAFSVVALLCFGILAAYWIVARREAGSVGAIHVVALVPGGARSPGVGLPRIQIPEGTTTLEIHLAVPELKFDKYMAELRSHQTGVSEVQSVKTHEDSGKKSVIFQIRTDVLPVDDYQLKLNGIDAKGDREFIDMYSFGVRAR